MSLRTCDCGRPADAEHGACSECLHREVVASRAAQGLPPSITDDRALRHLTRIAFTDIPKDAA